MCEISPLMSTLIQNVLTGPASTVKIFQNGATTYGVQGKAPYSDSAGIVIKGFWGKPGQQAFVEMLTNAVNGSDKPGGPRKLEKSFTFAANQINFTPTTKAKIVEPDGKNWEVIQEANNGLLGDNNLTWTVPVREIYP